MPNIRYATQTRPFKGEINCGDLPWVKRFEGYVYLAMIDVAGHGEAAAILARECTDFFDSYYQDPNLINTIQTLHQTIRGTRGLVIATSLVDIETGELKYAGVGNIQSKIFGKTSHTFVPNEGVVGYQICTPEMYRYILQDGDTLIMHSDGVSQQLNILTYPNLLSDPVAVVAKNITDKFGKSYDDCGCIVMRYTL